MQALTFDQVQQQIAATPQHWQQRALVDGAALRAFLIATGAIREKPSVHD
jgi:hypothetical protein